MTLLLSMVDSALFLCPFEMHSMLSTHPACLLISDRGAFRTVWCCCMKMCYLLSPQLSIVYIVTKDNKCVTKHQARC